MPAPPVGDCPVDKRLRLRPPEGKPQLPPPPIVPRRSKPQKRVPHAAARPRPKQSQNAQTPALAKIVPLGPLENPRHRLPERGRIPLRERPCLVNQQGNTRQQLHGTLHTTPDGVSIRFVR